jgi:hypothetical protein
MKVYKLIDCVAASQSLEDCGMENRLQLQIRARAQLQETFQANAQQGSCVRLTTHPHGENRNSLESKFKKIGCWVHNEGEGWWHTMNSPTSAVLVGNNQT